MKNRIQPMEGSVPVMTEKSTEKSAQMLRGRQRWIALLPLLAALAVFRKVPQYDFLSWDDNIHVFRNPHFEPVTIQSVLGFWQSPYEGLYCPLSYTLWAGLAMAARLPAPRPTADGLVVTLNPATFHAANLTLHLLNVLLVFFLLRFLLDKATACSTDKYARARGAQAWAAAAGATLFAIHPLQVEPVAWISELRGLLSAFFSLLALRHYLFYADGVLHTSASNKLGQRTHYALAMFCFVCALLSKPSAASLPLIAWILDCWVLRRPALQGAKSLLPWFVIALTLIMVTKTAQPMSNSNAPAFIHLLWTRPLVAGDALIFYLAKLVVPLPLGIFYGRTPQWVLQWPSWSYLLGVIPYILGIWFWRNRVRRPWVFAASGVFVAGVLPMLGFAPFAFQILSTVADRYLYMAMLGPAMALAWGLLQYQNRRAQGLALAILLSLSGMAALQTRYWSTTETLFLHALKVNPRSFEAHDNLALLARRRGDMASAIHHYQQVVSLQPTYAPAHVNLGNMWIRQGQSEKAIFHYRQAILIKPDQALAQRNLASALAETGNLSAAEEHYKASLRIDPRQPKTHYNWAIDLEKAGRQTEAVRHYQEALRINPEFSPARTALEAALTRQRKQEPPATRQPQSGPR